MVSGAGLAVGAIGQAVAQQDSGETLQNVAQCTGGIINGSAPHTDADFAALARLGVKTIIAVDGAYPDAQRAREYGIRTAHLPIGYDGVTGPRAIQLVRAVRDLPEPVYIHCLHGKHRSPSVTAYVSVSLGQMTNEQGIEYLHKMGTSENYPGLYASVRTAARLNSKVIDAVSDEFPERTPVGDLVETMVAADTAWGHIAEIREAGWRSPPGHPDLTPASEAAILVQQLEHVTELPAFASRPDEFKQKMNQTILAARELREAAVQEKWIGASALSERVEQGCAACHTRFRDR
jgi:protein tyrosine phosphatase (PTP) superfamily phosphohydrolase (DUF442 family)